MIQTLLMAASLFTSLASATTDPDDLGKYRSPWIEGETLHIQGVIDSHIYDYLAREAQALKKVKVVELNSLGGNMEWALESARKLRELGIKTRLSEGNFCASACVYLFAAGQVREADEGTWLGIHGARLGARYSTTFWGLCFVEMEDGEVFEPRKRGCQEFLNEWYVRVLESTRQGFAQMEANGVASSLWETYMSLQDDPEWYKYANILKKPDWVLDATESLRYNLATQVSAKN